MWLQLIVICCILLFILLKYDVMFCIRNLYYMLKLPGGVMIPYIGYTSRAAFISDDGLIDLMKPCHDDHDIFRLWFIGKSFVFLTLPQDLEAAMSSIHHITKGSQYNSIMTWLKEGLLTSKGKKWQQRRKLLTSAFHFKILEDCLPIMNTNAQILAENLLALQGKPADIDKYVTLCTLDVICEAAMGIRLNSQYDKAKDYVDDIRRICSIIGQKELNVAYFFNPIFNLTPTGREFKKMLKRLHEFTEMIIATRKETFAKELLENPIRNKKKMAFLDCLIDLEHKNPGTLSLTDMREEVDTFMFEGHDTTSVSIVFSLFLLGLHKDVQNKAVQEQVELFGNSDRAATSQDLQKMVYLGKIIKESLRLYPSVPYMSRYLTNDLVLKSKKLEGKIVPAGTNILIVPFLLHRNKNVWPDAEKFDPERFSEENSKQRHPYSYIPFSAGPRNCIGQKFAMMELKVVLSTLLRKCIIESITERNDLKYIPIMILRPNKTIMARFTRRTI